jgi:uncharacterized protein
LLGVITGFIDELRQAGVPVSMVETIDAMEALEVSEIGDRSALRETLRATLVKNLRHERAFDTAFDVYFSMVPAADPDDITSGPDQEGAPDRSEGNGFDQDALADAILQALTALDDDALRAAVRSAVDRLAGMEPGRPVGGTYYLYRTLRRLDMAGIGGPLGRAAGGRGSLRLRASPRPRGSAASPAGAPGGDRGGDSTSPRGGQRSGSSRPDSAATPRRGHRPDARHLCDLAEMEAAIGPLTRKLAARLARRRKKRQGRLDFRRTVRKSLATGGVPAEPQFRHPRPHRPEVWLICDISGSMATFSRFTLQFTHSMAAHFSKLRTFAFVDTVDEVTGFFGPGVDFGSAVARVASEAEVVWLDGHSDYGNSLETFFSRYGPQLTSKTTVIITGDARNNYRPPRDVVLSDIARSARALIWLNPEPKAYWDTGDSAMSQYARHCTSVHEVRTLRQLEVFIEQLALPTYTRSG